jgi:hypothetical protein
VQSIGGTPLENLIVDSTEMPRLQGRKYLLAFVYTFSGWVEAFPMQTEKAQEVARCLLKEIIPGLEYLCLLDWIMGQPSWLR